VIFRVSTEITPDHSSHCVSNDYLLQPKNSSNGLGNYVPEEVQKVHKVRQGSNIIRARKRQHLTRADEQPAKRARFSFFRKSYIISTITHHQKKKPKHPHQGTQSV